MDISVFTDGGSRGNPGPAAIGVVVYDENKNIIFELAKYIGKKTNNQAEYQAVLEAIKWICQQGTKINRVEFYVDSELVAKQLNGEYKIKSANIKPLTEQINQLRNTLPFKIIFTHLLREGNKKADQLVNQALDNQIF